MGMYIVTDHHKLGIFAYVGNDAQPHRESCKCSEWRFWYSEGSPPKTYKNEPLP